MTKFQDVFQLFTGLSTSQWYSFELLLYTFAVSKLPPKVNSPDSGGFMHRRRRPGASKFQEAFKISSLKDDNITNPINTYKLLIGNLKSTFPNVETISLKYF